MPLALQAGFWGLLSGSALVIGALIAWFAHVPQRVIAAVMAFGSGVLISALSFELMGEAYTKSRKPEPIPREPSLLSLGVAAPSSPRQVLVNETWYYRDQGHRSRRAWLSKAPPSTPLRSGQAAPA